MLCQVPLCMVVNELVKSHCVDELQSVNHFCNQLDQLVPALVSLVYKLFEVSSLNMCKLPGCYFYLLYFNEQPGYKGKWGLLAYYIHTSISPSYSTNKNSQLPRTTYF